MYMECKRFVSTTNHGESKRRAERSRERALRKTSANEFFRSPQWTDDPKKMSLSGISSPTTIVNLSFVQPACAYVAGQKSWQGTGLNFSQDFAVSRSAEPVGRIASRIARASI
jgi:hypothetical protein